VRAYATYDCLGYVAAALVVAAFYMKEIIPLRIVAVCSNCLFLTYGLTAHIAPVIALHLTLLPLNLLRLHEAGHSKKATIGVDPARDAQSSDRAIVLEATREASVDRVRGRLR
jgi:hypothetical protein